MPRVWRAPWSVNDASLCKLFHLDKFGCSRHWSSRSFVACKGKEHRDRRSQATLSEVQCDGGGWSVPAPEVEDSILRCDTRWHARSDDDPKVRRAADHPSSNARNADQRGPRLLRDCRAAVRAAYLANGIPGDDRLELRVDLTPGSPQLSSIHDRG